MRSNTNFVQEHYSLLWVISGRGVADVPGVRNPELADLIRKIGRFINIFPYKDSFQTLGNSSQNSMKE